MKTILQQYTKSTNMKLWKKGLKPRFTPLMRKLLFQFH